MKTAEKYLIQFDQGFLTFSGNLTLALKDALLYSHQSAAAKALDKPWRRKLGTNPRIRPVKIILEDK
jgi:hypothetical protein